MADNDNLYKSILDHLYDGVYFVDTQRRITYWNLGAERITGYSAGEVINHFCSDNLLMHVDYSGCLLCTSDCPLTAAMKDRQVHEAQVYLKHALGHRVPVQVRAAPLLDAEGRVIGAVETFSDNSGLIDAQSRAEELALKAAHDPLTGIANRSGLQAALDAALEEVNSGGRSSALVMFDLDFFKEVNDTHGHAVGDELLKMVARTLQANVRPRDTVGRWGGEEFLAVLRGVSEKRLNELAGRLTMLIEKSTLQLESGAQVRVTASSGAAMLCAGESAEDALRRVDSLLYHSKRNGRNRLSIEA